MYSQIILNRQNLHMVESLEGTSSASATPFPRHTITTAPHRNSPSNVLQIRIRKYDLQQTRHIYGSLLPINLKP